LRSIWQDIDDSLRSMQVASQYQVMSVLVLSAGALCWQTQQKVTEESILCSCPVIPYTEERTEKRVVKLSLESSALFRSITAAQRHGECLRRRQAVKGDRGRVCIDRCSFSGRKRRSQRSTVRSGSQGARGRRQERLLVPADRKGVLLGRK
jgi:hypothetical protein